MVNFEIATTVARSQHHVELLQEAVQTSVDLDETIEIITESFTRILFNKKLLLVFSKSLRNCMVDIPCCSLPNITVPSITASSLAKVQEILLKTINNVPIDFDDEDVEEIVEAAETLGIEMRNIVLVGGGARRRVKTVQPKIEREVVELPEEPVTEQVDEDEDDKALMINVDISSDEEETAEEDEERSIDMARMVLTNKMETMSSGSELLDGQDDEISDEESLQEESQRMSFSFLKNNDSEEGEEDAGEMSFPSLMITPESDNEDVSTDSKANVKVSEDAEPRLRCELCGKPQKGPSALREHYSLTHFFQELFDKFVASNESHTICK